MAAAVGEDAELGSPMGAVVKTPSIHIKGRHHTVKRLEDELIVAKEVVGTGMSGPVHMATGKQDQRRYAVKTFKKAGMPAKKVAQFQAEVDIYLAMDHPHIARLDSVYETDDEVHIVMEFMAGGELYDRLAQQKRYSEGAAARTTFQMLLAICYLHSNQVAHRDLKLENFLYETKDTDHLKLIDFGFAKIWDHGTVMCESCGSVHYVAPEVLRKAYTPKADLWSLGVIVYMLLAGTSPWSGDDRSVLKQVRSGEPRYGQSFGRLTPVAQDFVRGLLVVDEAERMTASQALEHSFIAGNRQSDAATLDVGILASLKSFAHASHFKRACLSMMAWSLDRQDRAALREKFLALDESKEGTITHHELRRSLLDAFHVDSGEARRLFEGLDVNNNEVIDYSEFLAAVALDRVRLHEDVLRRTFSRFDRDGNGTITVGELRSVLGDSFEGELVEDLIREADTNKDGALQYCEFLQYLQRPEERAEELPCAHVPEHGSRKHAHVEMASHVVDRYLAEHAEPQSVFAHASKARILLPRDCANDA